VVSEVQKAEEVCPVCLEVLGDLANQVHLEVLANQETLERMVDQEENTLKAICAKFVQLS